MKQGFTFSKNNAVVLKPERDKHVRNKHPWVFMGAISSYPEGFVAGSIAAVISDSGLFIGYGYFNPSQSISGRMFAFAGSDFDEADVDPQELFVNKVRAALAMRTKIIPENTNAYRLINGEGDGVPGLVVDRYADVLVLQVNTLGIELMKPAILKVLESELGQLSVFEKTGSTTSRKEGLVDKQEWLVGDATTTAAAASSSSSSVEILEHGNKFSIAIDAESGMQKTGFFLDQREMRQLVKNFSKNRSLLNCFSYTGGFSVYALNGGAKSVHTVDISDAAISAARVNIELNGFGADNLNTCFTADVLPFLTQNVKKGDYDFIILDPPAFAKRSSDVKNASRGYRDINRAAMEKLESGSFLLTSSCSSHIDLEMFKTIIFQAAKDTKKNVKILSYHILAADHPINLFYPEGDYLKSLLLYIE
jgi:23S rRNA (cytosine1962-C5)-methyltransferase